MSKQVIIVISGLIVILISAAVLLTWMVVTEDKSTLPDRGSICVLYQDELYCIRYDSVIVNGN